eukprot:7479596-Pyramimonas_sp.AAC.1
MFAVQPGVASPLQACHQETPDGPPTESNEKPHSRNASTTRRHVPSARKHRGSASKTTIG